MGAVWTHPSEVAHTRPVEAEPVVALRVSGASSSTPVLVAQVVTVVLVRSNRSTQGIELDVALGTAKALDTFALAGIACPTKADSLQTKVRCVCRGDTALDVVVARVPLAAVISELVTGRALIACEADTEAVSAGPMGEAILVCLAGSTAARLLAAAVPSERPRLAIGTGETIKTDTLSVVAETAIDVSIVSAVVVRLARSPSCYGLGTVKGDE